MPSFLPVYTFLLVGNLYLLHQLICYIFIFCSGKVVEVTGADGMIVKTPNGEQRKVFLSSVRPPRPAQQAPADGSAPADPRKNIRERYEVVCIRNIPDTSAWVLLQQDCNVYAVFSAGIK
mgnify:CR=1 FL=1